MFGKSKKRGVVRYKPAKRKKQRSKTKAALGIGTTIGTAFGINALKNRNKP